eukprot:484191_1
MSLTKAVKFRSLTTQLNKNETRQFMHYLSDNHFKLIEKALFDQILNVFSINEAENINQLISNIIQSRKEKPKPIQPQNIKLDNLPKSLIGVTASFLTQYDYINFSKCNRSIFIGCNSPNLMQEFIMVSNHPAVNLALYPSITNLYINFCRVHELMIQTPITDLPVINQLTHMSLSGNQTNCDIDPFMTQNIINTNTVTQLQLFNLGSRSNINHSFNPIKLIKILNKFPNISYLHLAQIYSSFDPNKIKKLYPNLKGLALSTQSPQRNMSLLNLFASNLEFLKLNRHHANTDYNLDDLIFSKLEELYMPRPHIKSIDGILKTAQNLQKVYIKTSKNDKCFMTSNETERIMKKLIMSCKYLEYIEFEDEGELFKSALSGIESGLFQTRKWNRKQMKIYIKINKPLTDNEHKNENILENEVVAKLVHWLENSNINDFMFILELDKTDTHKISETLKNNMSSNVETILVNGLIFVITNKNCTINGFGTRCNFAPVWIKM